MVPDQSRHTAVRALPLAAIALLFMLDAPAFAHKPSGVHPLEPASAEEEPVVTPEDPEVLRENAVDDPLDEEGKLEVPIEPLSDRCAALEVENSAAGEVEASELEAGEPEASEPEASEPEAASDQTSELSSEPEQESATPVEPEQTAETPAEVIADPNILETATSEITASEAAEAESAEAESAETEPTEIGPTEIGPTEIESTEAESAEAESVESEAELDPEIAAQIAKEKQDICQLYQADQLYQQGQISEAITLYQGVKPPFEGAADSSEALVAVSDPQELPPAGQVYLREANAGQEQQLETRMLVPLKLLTQQHPEFVPGHIQYAEALKTTGRAEQALETLNQAAALHPSEADLILANIQLASEQKQWIDASMQARRFAQLNPDHPQAEEFVALAQENLKLFQGDVRDQLTANTIANVLTGAVTYGVTGNIWNTLSTIQTTTLMLRGEEGVGNGISKSIQRQIPLVEDEEVVTYVQELGQKLASVAGRDEFEYEFFVIMDENLNAFALPGGKIFVNAGAIAKTRSEAELAGLLAHEISHSVLSHGFQLVSNGSLLSDISRFVPYAGYAANLVVLDYSRDMEREADELGTRILSAAGYPADGLHNLMQTLGEENKSRPLFAWMSTHPETDERVENIERQIQREGFERYGFEGVEKHDRIRERVKVLIEEAKKKAEEEAKNRPWWR